MFLIALTCITPLKASKASEIAAPDKALTMAQTVQKSGQKNTYLVRQVINKKVTAIDISRHFNYFPDDPLNFFKNYSYEELESLYDREGETLLDYQSLLPSGGTGGAHIAAGTNYLEHGEEADINEVFLFPKFAKATPSYSQIRYQPDALLDYEVELCMRWVEDLEQPEQAKGLAGLFVCGDFTDRATLLRKIDVGNVTSGHGFTDAKSGEKRFPTGPYIVVPEDWSSFIDEITLSTYVNGERRQHARANEMIRSPQELIEMIFEKGSEPLWRYQNRDAVLFEGNTISNDQTLITGTPEGVIYNTPGWGYRTAKSLKWLATLSFMNSGPITYILEEYIAESKKENRFLQEGDNVQLTATYLGNIEVDITK
ncbi:fumarylacetoacetate hydrolase [Veronia pacifica]|uniref:Fumarylacetoacetate hydrolase n=1 Tax=Veronia pacifica TaxID=1080227 RepID=A0A1C3E869_9GAMM|nr:fumarylacetoacetate hydrolase [Veronia pacifica]